MRQNQAIRVSTPGRMQIPANGRILVRQIGEYLEVEHGDFYCKFAACAEHNSVQWRARAESSSMSAHRRPVNHRKPRMQAGIMMGADMKILFVLGSFLLLGTGWSAPAQAPQQPVDYISPNIGGIGQLLTSHAPDGAAPPRYGNAGPPLRRPESPDRYLADKIFGGFPAGSATLMASTGEIATTPATYASDFDHDLETVTPYYYEADLESWQIRAELTATNQAAYYRFTFQPALTLTLCLRSRRTPI